MKKMKLGGYVLSAVLLCVLLIGSVSAAHSPDGIAAGWMEASLDTLARGSSQVVLVTGDDSRGFHATLHALERRGGAWRYAFPPLPALIGEKGFAPPGGKREGDLRTPAGVFPLRRTFGYAPEIATRMPYFRVGKDDLWVDDPSSADYNRWVKRGETSASSFEVMKLDDDRYRYVIVVEYNTAPVVRGAGSAIFIHVRFGEDISTLGCVALSEEGILRVLAWLDPAAKPLALLGTRDALVELARNAGERDVEVSVP
jgi:L,D-peptidoglycan transpeptidase YkuD (ErfK/YbiS/YcfS/YnhG family)